MKPCSGFEEYNNPDGLTVGHIMPQHWKEHWPLVEEAEPFSPEEIVHRKEERNRNIHAIGNLTFLTDQDFRKPKNF